MFNTLNFNYRYETIDIIVASHFDQLSTIKSQRKIFIES